MKSSNKEESESSESPEFEEIDDGSVAYEKPASFCTMYNFLKLFMRFCMNQFFRDITILGLHNIPKKGPVIFCGNH